MRLLIFELLSNPADSIGGGGKGTAAHIQLGTAWQGFRIQHGFSDTWGWIIEAQSVSWERWQPSVGLSAIWYEGPMRITGSILGGWLTQTGPFPWNGPSAEARIQISKPFGRLRPWLLLGSKHSMGYLRTEIQTQDELLIEDTLQTEWTMTGSLGFAIGVHKGWELNLGLDMPWVNYPNITIPGFHVAIAHRGTP